MGGRYVGIDLGAEALKVVELVADGDSLREGRRVVREHRKRPGAVLLEVLAGFDWDGVTAAAVTGRFGRQVRLPRVPPKAARVAAFRFRHGEGAATVVSIGARGFAAVEIRAHGPAILRENTRCSQGTGNFLRQLIGRFDLSVDEASRIVDAVADPAALSGRCPVILKTDLTHLANRGEDKARVLAGLFDAVAENALVLVKPGLSPPRVLLAGGVTRAGRVRALFRRTLAKRGFAVLPWDEDEAVFLDALGAALVASRAGAAASALPRLADLLAPEAPRALEHLGPLAPWLGRVRRIPRPTLPNRPPARLFLGLDIGSTGSKALALDVDAREPVWQAYTRTNGDPVGAAQELLRQFAADPVGRTAVLAIGVTGSGREIVASLLTTCFGAAPVYVLNEIAAHAAGARHYDRRVDTIFEIGGQDAKYIRLDDGRVVDAAMNEACSAGTGSFIEEQGRRFAGVTDVVELGHAALAADGCVSLGQHCSVFMAEVIDEAIAAGAEQGAIIAGIYDAIVRNYLNRVKGNRTVGDVIFCQGMPFSAPALAAAVARQTGREVIVPPDPGTVGALGIALLALADIDVFALAPIDVRLVQGARVAAKTTFVCRANRGCGGAGNRCRIDRLDTVVDGQTRQFMWGGACSLYDHGVRRVKLPDRAPDPFREREELVAEIARGAAPTGTRRIALTDEFVLRGLFPFFVAYFRALGLRPEVHRGADRGDLRRGTLGANVPFCAPMQLYHGMARAMAADAPELLFLPMLRSLPRTDGEIHGAVCPIAQGSADVLRADLGAAPGMRILSPVLDVGRLGLDSPEFRAGCRAIARDVGAYGAWAHAFATARRVQRTFDGCCEEIGRRALAYCAEHAVTPVVVVGRPYTIHNDVLNSNVPALLREQGVLPIPLDCLPLDGETPACTDVYWAHGQRMLRAAQQVRRTPGMYAVFCSNYACGPDSFNAHFVADAMSGKPFAVIETDGHAGDAGTKTRLEAFLHCVREHLGAGEPAPAPRPIAELAARRSATAELRSGARRVLVPWLSEASAAVPACLRGVGFDVEHLPPPGVDELLSGQRCTSGKECLPLALTIGSVLTRVAREADPARRFALLMPSTTGPCRFGVYNLLHKLTLERLGLDARIEVWSPEDENYFEGLPSGFSGLLVAALTSIDVLNAALHDVRPREIAPGAAEACFERHRGRLLAHAEQEAAKAPTFRGVLREIATGRLWGFPPLLRRAALEFRALRGAGARPVVFVTGEIYVRAGPFASGFVIDRLEERGLSVRFSRATEWLEYAAWCEAAKGWRPALTYRLQRRIQARAYAEVGRVLGWPRRDSVEDCLDAAEGYLRRDLLGEAVLTIGGAVHAWRRGEIEGAVSVGPIECMPTKLAEAQFFHVAEREGLLTLTLPMSGDPIDPEILDAFAYEVKERYARRAEASGAVFVGTVTSRSREPRP